MDLQLVPYDLEKDATRDVLQPPSAVLGATMSTAHSLHACDLLPGDQLPHGNRVLRTLPWPNGDIDVEIAFTSGIRERFRYKPDEWITILVDDDDQGLEGR